MRFRTRRSRLIAALALALLALAGLLATTLYRQRQIRRDHLVHTAASTAPAATTTALTTTTTPATTRRSLPLQRPPAQAIVAARTAIAAAQANGQLDPSAATDLNHHLDDIAQTLQHPKPRRRRPQGGDLLHHLDDLANAGQLTNTGLTQISRPLNQLTTLLPAAPGPPGKGDNGQGNGNGA